jgi:predicted permease
MISYTSIVGAVLPVFVVILLGLALRKLRVLTGEADKSLMTMTISVLYPALILNNTIGNPELLDIKNVLIPASTGLLFVLFAMLIAYFSAPLFGLREDTTRRTFTVATGIQNYGYLAIPVLASVFPKDSNLLGLLFAHSLGVELALWTAGISIMSGVFKTPWKKLLNGPLIAIAIGLSLNFIGVGSAIAIPAPVAKILSMLGNSAIPLSLLLIGASVFDLTRDSKWIGSWQSSLGACLVRLVFAPALLLLALYFIPFQDSLKKVLIVQAAMPAALFPILMSRLYGGSPATAVQVAIMTTAASFVTIPLVILLGIHLSRL